LSRNALLPVVAYRWLAVVACRRLAIVAYRRLAVVAYGRLACRGVSLSCLSSPIAALPVVALLLSPMAALPVVAVSPPCCCRASCSALAAVARPLARNPSMSADTGGIDHKPPMDHVGELDVQRADRLAPGATGRYALLREVACPSRHAAASLIHTRPYINPADSGWPSATSLDRYRICCACFPAGSDIRWPPRTSNFTKCWLRAPLRGTRRTPSQPLLSVCRASPSFSSHAVRFTGDDDQAK
jgi:hypothetical protein